MKKAKINKTEARKLWKAFLNGDDRSGRDLCDMVGGHASAEWDGAENCRDEHGMFCAAQFAAQKAGVV